MAFSWKEKTNKSEKKKETTSLVVWLERIRKVAFWKDKKKGPEKKKERKKKTKRRKTQRKLEKRKKKGTR